MVISPRRILEPSMGTHGNVRRRLRIAGDQRSLTQRRWVIHRTELDRLPRQDICQNSGGHKPPVLSWNLRTTAAAHFRCGRQYPLTLTYAFDLTSPQTQQKAPARHEQIPHNTRPVLQSQPKTPTTRQTRLCNRT